MFLPEFQYHQPHLIDEVLDLMENLKENKCLHAGGTDLLVSLKQRRVVTDHIIDLGQLKELQKIELTDDNRLKIGTMATLNQVASSPIVQKHSPALAQAAWETGSPLLRNRGTVGGNIFQDTRCKYYNQSANWRKGKETCIKMGGDVCHINPKGKKCLSTYAGDLAPVFIAEGAEIEIATFNGSSERAFKTVFSGNGANPFNLQNSLATAVYINIGEGYNNNGVYWKLRSRPSIDFPIVGIALTIKDNVNVAVTGVTSKPKLAEKTSSALSGSSAIPKITTQIQETFVGEIKIISTDTNPAWYRRQMLERGLVEAIDQLNDKGGAQS